MIDFQEWDRQLENGQGPTWPTPINVPYIKNDYEIKSDKYRILLKKLQKEQNTDFAVYGDELSEEDKKLCRCINKMKGMALICFKNSDTF